MELNVSHYVAILANYISLIFASENLPMTKNICGKWAAQFYINTLPLVYQKHIQRIIRS